MRKIDDLGRVIIPAEMREKLNIHSENEVDISMQGNNIIINKHEFGCVFCGAVDNLVRLNDKAVCRECIDKLKAE